MTNVAVIGCGRWGVNYVRVFQELGTTRVDKVFDRDHDAMKKLLQRHPTIKAAASISEITRCEDIRAVVVATPASEHYEVVKECLKAGKNVLVEKPIALTIHEAKEMIELAENNGRVLMVGHTFLYNAGVRELKRCIRDERFGRVYYLHSTRTNMGPIRKDVNSAWDLATHDVSIFNYLLDSTPEWVSATGSRLLGNGLEDVSFITLGFPDNVMANIHVSWADPFKVREVVAVGSCQRVVFNDLESLERVKVFNKGVVPHEEANSFGEFRLLMRDGDITSPRIDNSEPLREQCLQFLDCVENGSAPVSDGTTGLDVVRVMLAVDESMRMHGSPVEMSRLAV